MQRIRSALGFSAVPTGQLVVGYPLGLREGLPLTIDPQLPSAMTGLTLVTFPGAQAIENIGVIDLGAGAQLYRVYLADEDYWLQVHTEHGQVESIVLFNYLSWVPMESQDHLVQTAGGDARGCATLTVNSVVNLRSRRCLEDRRCEAAGASTHRGPSP